MAFSIHGIPLFEVIIPDDNTGMFRLSLVDDPAVESNFLSFDKDKKVAIYAIANDEQRIVYGVIMRADWPIYRNDNHLGEYYITFSRETIRLMAEKYLREGRQNDFNVMHRDDAVVDGIDMVQFFIKDTERGIAPAGFDEIEDGSLFGEFHVHNDEVWQAIKEGTYKGFSLEGVFGFRSIDDTSITKPKFNNMSKIAKIKAALAKLWLELGAVTTDKGVLVWDGDDDLKAGFDVRVTNESGEERKAPDGDYTTEDGKTIKVVDGRVSEIVDPKAEVDGAEQGAGGGAGGDAISRDEFDTLRKDVDDIKSAVDEIRTAVADIKVAMEAIKKTPAGNPAHEEFNKLNDPVKTGDSRFDKLAAIAGARKK